MARTQQELYVDPSIAASSGTGTSGDPFGDLQYALDRQGTADYTRNATEGDRFNILTGTDEILSAALSFATYGTPTRTAPVTFRGYTSAAGDGGIGGVSGNGSVAVMTGSLAYVHFVDMHLHNTGSADIVDGGVDWVLSNVELDNTTGNACTSASDCMMSNCYVHNIGGIGFSVGDGSTLEYCVFENGTNDFTACVDVATGTRIYRCLFDIDGTTNAINVTGNSGVIEHNSIYSNAGTGYGIGTATGSLDPHSITNNIIEGFSGTGGEGISFTGTLVVFRNYGGNAFYDNETDETLTNVLVIKDHGDNESLSESAFTDAANNDFSPVDTGNVKEGALPTIIGDGSF